MSSGSTDPARVLSQGLEELGMALDPRARQALVELAVLLSSWAERINLTGHRSAEAAVRRLILDALAMSLVLPPWRQLIDLGSGAGFPGLPLALAHPDRRVVLVEARERRHHFQRFAIRSLAISNATALRGRAERLEPIPGDLVVAQALAAPTRALELAVPWASIGGWIALPGGEVAPAPLELPGQSSHARSEEPAGASGPGSTLPPMHPGPRAAAAPPIGASRIASYRVPCGGPRRTLWLGQRPA